MHSACPMRNTTKSSVIVATMLAGCALSIAACAKDEPEQAAQWTCRSADVPMGEVVRCSRQALTSDGPSGSTGDGTTYACEAGSTSPDCPPADATGGGGTSDGTAPSECGEVPDLPYCPGGGGETSDDGKGKKDAPPGQEKKNGGTGDGTTETGGGGRGGGGKEHHCTKGGDGSIECESTPDCAPGTIPSTCGACVPEGEEGDCVPPSAGGCWVTGGGFVDSNDGKDNFGGNAKPMKDGRVQGNWNHVDHGGGHHAQGKPAYIVCRHVDGAGPGQPGGKKGFTMNQVYFGGPASWDLEEGHWFDVVAKDRGEPGREDTYHLTVRKMVDLTTMTSGAVVYEVSGTLGGGNIQMHPPNGGHPYTPMTLPSWVAYEP